MAPVAVALCCRKRADPPDSPPTAQPGHITGEGTLRGLSPCGQKILPTRAGSLTRRGCPTSLLVENIPGQAEQRSGVGQKVFGFSPEFVFAFSPEWCSESSRNAVRLQPGMVFAFNPESCSGCPGIRSTCWKPPNRANKAAQSAPATLLSPRCRANPRPSRSCAATPAATASIARRRAGCAPGGKLKNESGYWGATEQKTRLRIQATSSVRSDWAPQRP
jgi:hypothetical protein